MKSETIATGRRKRGSSIWSLRNAWSDPKPWTARFALCTSISLPTSPGMLSSQVRPSPNITDSPVNRIVGRSGSTGWSTLGTR